MKDILSQIIEHKKTEVQAQKQAIGLEQLREQVKEQLKTDNTPRRSMKQALAQSATGIIAEFKRRSPSKGWINRQAQTDLIPPGYEASGASALSILTDETFFGGTLDDIRTARPLTRLPILRKDFIIDEYQLLQACLAGADAVLLIAACLTCEECATLAEQAHALGLEVLLELHSESELAYLSTVAADMVGINNRNLGSFVTDVANSFRIADRLRQQTSALLVSESGISSMETIQRLRAAGYRGFLLGEPETVSSIRNTTACLTTNLSSNNYDHQSLRNDRCGKHPPNRTTGSRHDRLHLLPQVTPLSVRHS